MESLIDTHCHLNHQDFARDLDDVLRRASMAGVSHMVCVGYDLPSSVEAVKIAHEKDNVYAAVGIHPHDADTFDTGAERELTELASRPRVVAIGETGLDYHRDLSPRGAQQDAYRRHIQLASRLDLPLIVHSRDAWQDVIRILDEEGMPGRGVIMHCFPSEPDFAEAALERECMIGIAGPVTFQNADRLRQVAASVPLDRLLAETDAPYLTPHPHRGRRNEPSYLPLIVEKLAQVKGVSADEVARQTTANAISAFGLVTCSFVTRPE